jgi:hypothetical protein
MLFLYFSEDVFAGLATAEELAKGASVAQEGLAVPPRREPTPSALASRPSPADVLGPGEFLLLCSTLWFVFCYFILRLVLVLRRCF